jgi:hypothetical protein
VDKQTAINLIKDFHKSELPNVIGRDLVAKVPVVNKAITVIGPRRAGKTYFMFDIIGKLAGINRTETLYVNFEDHRLQSAGTEDIDIILKTYYEIYPQNKDKTLYLFLDEIQNVKGWELFVRRTLDTEKVRVYLTGSSSKLLVTEIATSMRGRSIGYTILPFSFGEFLRIKGVKPQKYLSSKETAWILKYLDDYVKNGGFPEITLESDEYLRLKILNSYIDTLLLKDVIDRYQIKNTKVLRMLYNGIIASFSREFSIHKFKRFVTSQGIKVSKNTLYEYAQKLSDAFAYIPVKKYSTRLRETEQSLPKVYLIDNGYAVQAGVQPTENMGRLLENTVAVELFRRQTINHLIGFYYWKGNNNLEVDFVITRTAKVKELIQVCFDPTDIDTNQRETRPLIKAADDLACNDLKIITWNLDKEEKASGKTITYIPLWRWLLE